jgi:hypothetical protein
MNAWVYSPQSGGNKIPEKYHWQIRQEAEKFVRTRPWYNSYELILRFRNQFCYVDALKKGETKPFPLGRLRYFDRNRWSLAFYTYSNETYQPCVFLNGEWDGALEDAIMVCEAHLDY